MERSGNLVATSTLETLYQASFGEADTIVSSK